MVSAEIQGYFDEAGRDRAEGCGYGLIARTHHRSGAGRDVIAHAVGDAEGLVVGDGLRVPIDPSDQPMRRK